MVGCYSELFLLGFLALSSSFCHVYQPKDDSEANGSAPSSLSSPVSGGGHQGEPPSRETTDTEAAGITWNNLAALLSSCQHGIQRDVTLNKAYVLL